MGATTSPQRFPYAAGICWPAGKKGTVPICRNGPKGAAHKRGLPPFSLLCLLAACCPLGLASCMTAGPEGGKAALAQPAVPALPAQTTAAVPSAGPLRTPAASRPGTGVVLASATGSGSGTGVVLASAIAPVPGPTPLRGAEPVVGRGRAALGTSMPNIRLQAAN